MLVNTTLTGKSNFTMKCTDSGVTCSASTSPNCQVGDLGNIMDGSYSTGCEYSPWGACGSSSVDVTFNFKSRATTYSFGTPYQLFYNSSFMGAPTAGSARHLLFNQTSNDYTDFLLAGGDTTLRTYSTTTAGTNQLINNTDNIIRWRNNNTGGYIGQVHHSCYSVNELSFILETAQSANYTLDIGFDGTVEDNYIFTSSGLRQANFSQGLTNYLANCTADSLGICTVPVYLSSKVPATYVLSNLQINYTINPISLSASALNSYLANNCTGTAANTTCNIPIKISSSTAGNITASYLLDYEGFGSYQWNLTDATGSTVYDSRIINVTSSWINRTYPKNIRYVEFIPKTKNDKNVSASGQNTNNPIWNFTWNNYKLNANMTLWINNTFSDINVTASSNCSGPSNGITLNTTPLVMFSNVSFGTNNGICLWANYYNSSNRFRIFTFFYKTFCSECW